MEPVDALSTTTTMAGFLGVVAGIGAVCAYGYTQRSSLTRHAWRLFGGDAEGHTHTIHGNGGDRENERDKGTGSVRKGRRRRRGKGTGVGVGGDDGEGGRDGSQVQGHGKADEKETTTGTTVIPGDFDSAVMTAGARVGTGASGPPMTTAGTEVMPGNSGKMKKRKKKNQNQGRTRGRDNDKDAENNEAEEVEEREASSEADKEAGIVGGRTAVAYRVHSGGDSTDASVSVSPSVLDSTLGHLRGSTTTRLDATSSRPQIQARPSFSFDTDSSWTHVDHLRIKSSSRSTDGHDQLGMDTMDMTSSDQASTASDSPVAERTDNTTDIRGEREDLPQRTLAERLAPKPSKTGVDDMLEKPDFPTLARVMRVQPRADETPVAGFSWDDYGDVVEDSLLVHDADQEDEGEWGIVKSRSRTRPQPQTMATPSTSHDAAVVDTVTKKQRQNARKRELAKAAKVEAEAARLQGLAKHKRELERLRIIGQSQQGGGKRPSGGMQASVDDRGKLVWE